MSLFTHKYDILQNRNKQECNINIYQQLNIGLYLAGYSYALTNTNQYKNE